MLLNPVSLCSGKGLSGLLANDGGSFLGGKGPGKAHHLFLISCVGKTGVCMSALSGGEVTEPWQRVWGRVGPGGPLRVKGASLSGGIIGRWTTRLAGLRGHHEHHRRGRPSLRACLCPCFLKSLSRSQASWSTVPCDFPPFPNPVSDFHLLKTPAQGQRRCGASLQGNQASGSLRTRSKCWRVADPPRG